MGLFIRRITILFLLLAATQIFPQTSLMVLDPQQSWRTYPASIDEAILSVGPKGIYFQISAYLTFSAKGSNLTTANPLEVVYNFELPDGSFVTDMWLWIGDKISNGKIMDLWSASQIYESIVKRKQDPAILKKTGAKSYQLRVYPMGANETRKVKITYLTPVTWGLNNVVLKVPTNLLSVSALQIPKLLLKTWKTTDWGSPIFSDPNYSFSLKNDSFFGEHYEADITNLSRVYSNYLTFTSPMVDGVYFKYYKQGEEGYYELAMFPGNSLTANTKKILFLMDYDLRKSTTTREQLLSNLKLQLRSSMSLKDSFNIMFSGLSIGKASPNWVSGDPANIDKVFNSITENSISTYSNLPTLMSAGIDYMNKNGASGKLFLLSNSDLQGNNVTANQLITDLKKLMTVNYPVMIYDYNDKDYTYYYYNGRSYVGNEYFYDNLSRATGGTYQRIAGNITATLADLFSKLNGTISSYDLYTSTQTGFCFARQSLNGKGEPYSIGNAMTQLGKYSGEFPFNLKFSGIYNSQAFSTTKVLNNAADKKGDDVIRQTWIGNYINQITSITPSNSIINEVIGLSRTHKVLTSYTAFLALENDTSWCTTCYNESKPGGGGNTDLAVDGTSEIPSEFSMDAYPNPFNSQVTITVKLPNNMLVQKLSFKIYSLLGQVVKTFTSEEIQNNSVVKLFWNGKNESGEAISSGVYLFSVSGGKFVKTLKLMYMK